MTEVGRDIPTGTVTLVLADVEGSVRRWETDASSMSRAMARLDEIVTEAAARHRGARPVEQGEGDSFVLAFAGAEGAIACALDIQLALTKEAWPRDMDLRLRMALHTGEARLRDDDNYAGPEINRCARLRALAHGGQTLLSGPTHDLVVDRLSDGASLRGLGVHRLRDLARPERVYQLCHPDLRDDFPVLRSLSALPNNLPVQLTSFVGRTAELRDIASILGSTRVLTLTGAGGCGKTRLALQAAADTPDVFPDGLWWVDLAPVSDSAAVASTVAAALSIAESAGEAVLPRLVEMLADRRLLIILDNCEHLIDSCAEVARAILAASPAVSIVATSREPLGIPGEVTFRVPSLPLADENAELDELMRSDAVRLFVERAALVRPHFALDAITAPAVAQICRQLDGIPLAIELAAARTRLLSPSQIAEALADRFRVLTGGARASLARQRTLEASVDWSYRLLSETERSLLQRLSVFAGSFSLEAVEQVCSDEQVEQYAILELLSSLADRSLVQVDIASGRARYRLLETIRAYARDRLAAEGEPSALRDRHLAYFVGLAVEAERGLQGPTYAQTLEALDVETANLRAAIEWALATNRPEDAMRIAGELSTYWLVRGRHAEMKRMVHTILDAGPDADPALRLKTLWTGVIVSFTGDFGETYGFATEAERIAAATGNDDMLARGLLWKGWCEYWMGKGDGLDALRRGLDLARSVGDPIQIGRGLQYNGTVLALQGDVDNGEPMLREAVDLATEAQNLPGLAASLFFWGGALAFRGQWTRAEDLLGRSLEISRMIGYGMFASNALWGLAHIRVQSGHIDEAGEHAGAAVRTARDAGAPLAESIAFHAVGAVALARGDFDEARRSFTVSRARAEAAHLAFQVGFAESALAQVAHLEGDRAEARRLYEASLSRAEMHVYTRADTLVDLARLERDEGRLPEADSWAREALSIAVRARSSLIAARALETLGGIDIDRERVAEGTRLLAAAAAQRASIGSVGFAHEAERFARDVARAQDVLGAAFDTTWREGETVGVDEAAAYALRGRGARVRATTGWDSLTPAEQQVVALVARGLTNPQIAERLFVSRHTVKVHLGHIFAKLGCSTRAEVAAEASRRGV